MSEAYPTTTGATVDLKCKYCGITWTMKESHVKTHRAHECKVHLSGCLPYLSKGNKLKPHSRVIELAECPPVASEPPPAAAVGVPVGGSIEDLLRKQIRLQSAQLTQMKEISSKLQLQKDTWKRVAKRPFQGNSPPSSPSSVDSEGTMASKVNQMHSNNRKRGELKSMHAVAGAMAKPSRKAGESRSHYVQKTIGFVKEMSTTMNDIKELLGEDSRDSIIKKIKTLKKNTGNKPKFESTHSHATNSDFQNDVCSSESEKMIQHIKVFAGSECGKKRLRAALHPDKISDGHLQERATALRNYLGL
jgi:hypothetical protein